MKFATIKIALLFFFVFQLKAQEQAAFRMLPTAGINRITLNPAYSATGQNRWDINLIEGSFFVANNYFYFRNTNTFDLINHLSDGKPVERFDPEAPPSKDGEEPLYFEYYGGTERRMAQISTNIMGPSVAFRIGDRHTLGIFNRFRFYSSSRNLPENLSYYTYFFRPFNETFRVNAFDAGAISWAEIGVNYSISFPTNDGEVRLGISPKYLMGFQAAYFDNERDFQLEKLPGDSIQSGPVALEFGYTENEAYGDESNSGINGRGFALDLGLEYLFGDLDKQWSLGFSILDLGRINFTESAVRHRVVQPNGGTILGGNSYGNYSSGEEFEQIIEQFSAEVLGDSSASFAGNSFAMGLPTAASFQVKKNFTSSLALGMTYHHPMRIFENTPSRIPTLSLLPMYSTKWFGVVLPVSVYDWQRVRLGAHLQLGWLHLGTEHLLSYARKGDFYGSDFYVALKVQPFKINSDRSELRKRKRRSSSTGCYYGF